MTDLICFVVAFGVVIPWLIAGACMLAEWTYAALKHCWRMRTDPMYREVEIQFTADLVEAGLDGRTIHTRSILWWTSVVAMAGFLSSDTHWLWSMGWLWAMSEPLIALEFAAILVAAGCLNVTVVSFASRLRPRRDPMGRGDTDDSDNWDDLLHAAEELSAQYEAIANGDHRRTGE